MSRNQHEGHQMGQKKAKKDFAIDERIYTLLIRKY